jgi:hypothetical protein
MATPKSIALAATLTIALAAASATAKPLETWTCASNATEPLSLTQYTVPRRQDVLIRR